METEQQERFFLQGGGAAANTGGSSRQHGKVTGRVIVRESGLVGCQGTSIIVIQNEHIERWLISDEDELWLPNRIAFNCHFTEGYISIQSRLHIV